MIFNLYIKQPTLQLRFFVSIEKINMESPNFYAILTANVRYDKTLSSDMKLLYAEITALTNKNGYCRALDQYFSEVFNVDKRSIQRWLKILESKGLINRKIIYGEGSKKIKQRIITLPTQMSLPTDTGVVTPTDTDVVDNNIIYNNISNNINISKDIGENNQINTSQSEATTEVVEDKEQSDEDNKITNATYGKEEINMLIDFIKKQCKSYGIVYMNHPKERMLAKALLSGKMYKEIFEGTGIEKLSSAISYIIKLSKDIGYGTPINNAYSFYYKRADTINRANSRQQEMQNEYKNIMSYTEEFEKFWETYPHYNPSSKENAFKLFEKFENKNDLIFDTKIILSRIKAGVQEGKFTSGAVKFLEGWVKNEDMRNQLMYDVYATMNGYDEEDKRRKILREYIQSLFDMEQLVEWAKYYKANKPEKL